jgi:hypothetical protein
VLSLCLGHVAGVGGEVDRVGHQRGSGPLVGFLEVALGRRRVQLGPELGVAEVDELAVDVPRAGEAGCLAADLIDLDRVDGTSVLSPA